MATRNGSLDHAAQHLFDEGCTNFDVVNEPDKRRWTGSDDNGGEEDQ